MADFSYYCGIRVFGSLVVCYFIISIISIILFIHYADHKYKFLSEVAVFTFLLSIIFMVITSNIRSENKKSGNKKSGSSKVIPI
jgi:hypothetical protein